VLVLVGDQNIGKSTFFRAIGGEWFNESKIETVNKDGLIVIHSAWLHEFPEVDQLTLFREAAPIKALITAQWDTFRAPYARGTATILRSCLFGATTNEECFLRDESGTGSSRWHPVYVNRIPTLAEMARERDQILAEAFALAAPRLGDDADPRSFLTKDEERQREELAADFRQVDPWDAALSRWLKVAPEVLYLRGKGRFAVPSEDVLSKCLKLREPGVGEQRRLSGLMKRRGWAHDRQRFPVGRTTPGVPARLGEPEYCYLAPDGWKPFDAVVDDVDHPAHLPD
jgi:putative DNA primase/helicase